MAGNLAELPRLVELCAEIGGDGVNVEELYDWEHPDLHPVYRREHLGALGPETVERLLAAARERAESLGVRLTCSLPPGAGAPLALEPEPAGQAVPPGPVGSPASAVPALPWACSEPWTTVNVTAAGEVRTCCFNDTVLGRLDEQPIDAVWQGAGYAELRACHGAGEVPASCANCVRGGRIKQSPYFLPGRSPLAAGIAGIAGNSGDAERSIHLEIPGPGEIVAGPLVLAGRVPRRTLPALAEVYLDEIHVTRLGDWAARDGRRFTASIPVLYLTAGKHRLSLHWLTRDGTGSWEHLDLQVTTPGEGGEDLSAVARVAIPVELQKSERRPELSVDGHRYPLAGWVCGARHGGNDGWLGVAAIDVRRLCPGVHEIELRFRRAPRERRRLWRVAV